MRKTMTPIHDDTFPAPPDGMMMKSVNPEHTPMHPEDYEAHFAWVTAKRFQELVRHERPAEKPVYYRILGSCRHIP